MQSLRLTWLAFITVALQKEKEASQSRHHLRRIGAEPNRYTANQCIPLCSLKCRRKGMYLSLKQDLAVDGHLQDEKQFPS